MAHHQNQFASGSNGSAHHGGNGQDGSGTAQSASHSNSGQYSMHYMAVVRGSEDPYERFKSVLDNPALRTGPISAYHVPHASPHGDARGYPLANGFHTSRTQPGVANGTESAERPSYAHQILYPAYGCDRDGPYDAVGYTRRDGQVYDKDELFEEYRPYGQVGRLGENRSNARR